MGNIAETNALWENFCRLRLRSPAYRAVDDPIVKAAYNDWLAAYLADDDTAKPSNVIPFRKAAMRT